MIKDLILRRTPEWEDKFLLEEAECEQECWSFEPEGEKVKIKASGQIAMAVGYYAFLRECCGAYFDCEHALQVAEFKLPSEQKSGEIKAKYRTCMEYTFLSCAACWWNWERWENEIDFMAMNGVNLPLTAVGTQAVWLKTMLDLGIKEEQALACISGPAFWGWQLYECFDGYFPQVRKDTVEKQIELGKKIFEREKQLGMQPLMHGFSGYIPQSFIKAKIRVRGSKTDEWCLFPARYHIAATDSTFHRIGSLYYRNLKLLIGEGQFFLADPFGAHAPAKNTPSFLAGVGAAVQKLVFSQNEAAVWVVRSSPLNKSMLAATERERVLVIGSAGQESDLKHISTVSFNSGDVTALHGEFAAVSSLELGENAVGFAAFSDGAYSNEAFRQFCYASLSSAESSEPWLKTYAKNRYQTDSPAAWEAFALLQKSCWRAGQPAREHGSAVCTRPSTLLEHTAIGDCGNEIEYNIADVFAAAQKLIEAGGKTYEYELDVCDVLRQALSDLANSVCKKALEGYKTKNAAMFEENSNLFLGIIEDMDRLMMTKKEFSLPHYLKLASSFGANEEESGNFEINVLAQMSLFGPMKDTVLYDTCWKEWGGALKTFYGVRWRAFFEYLAANFKKLRRVPEKTKHRFFERDAYLGSEFGARLSRVEKDWISGYSPEYEAVGRESTLDVAKELVSKYAPNF